MNKTYKIEKGDFNLYMKFKNRIYINGDLYSIKENRKVIAWGYDGKDSFFYTVRVNNKILEIKEKDVVHFFFKNKKGKSLPYVLSYLFKKSK